MGGLYTYKASADLTTLGQILVSKPLLALYPWPMRRVFLSLLLFAGLLVLPGCSNAEAEACDDAKSISEVYFEKASEFRFEYNVSIKIKNSLNQSIAGYYSRLADEQNLRARKVILDNLNCFLPEEVTQAEEILEKNNEVCARAKDESIHYLDRAMAELNCVKF